VGSQFVVGPVVAGHPACQFGVGVGASQRIDPGGIRGIEGEFHGQAIGQYIERQ